MLSDMKGAEGLCVALRECAGPAQSSYLCISAADVLIPCHNKTTRPAKATNTRNLVLVRKCITARDGGSLDFADFHVTPPLGSSIVIVDGTDTVLAVRVTARSPVRDVEDQFDGSIM